MNRVLNLFLSEITYDMLSNCLYLNPDCAAILDEWRLTSNGIDINPGKIPKNTAFLSAKALLPSQTNGHTRFLIRGILSASIGFYFLGAVPKVTCW